MASLNEATTSDIRKTVDDATKDPQKVPGAVFASVNKQGKPVFSHASGCRGSDTKEPMTMETVFWIASCTKLICGIAALQLVEQGKIGLDDADAVEGYCPELKAVKILKDFDGEGKPVLVDKKNRITLRMLLTHTAGFGYTFFNPLLKRYNEPLPFEEFSGYASDILTQPLVAEPGTAWQYGVNIDWAGVVIERVSGLKLNDYFQQRIFNPLDITDISMFPRTDMIRRLASMHQRDIDGKLRTRDHIHRRPLVADASEQHLIFNSAGAGCFAEPTEYCKILAALLNDGTSPTTGNTILKKASVDELLTNAIPHMPDFGRNTTPAAKPDQTNSLPEMYPQAGNPPQGWSIAGFLNIEKCPTGRSANSTWWAGLSNLFWFLDREKGVAGMIATQILPFGDPYVMGLWANIEIGIYNALA
ncbi:MAG: hypothetical protein MMC23_005689 [Stictis urceolatum]|nr:hypothetical protein [Stictis urceolata]